MRRWLENAAHSIVKGTNARSDGRHATRNRGTSKNDFSARDCLERGKGSGSNLRRGDPSQVKSDMSVRSSSFWTKVNGIRKKRRHRNTSSERRNFRIGQEIQGVRPKRLSSIKIKRVRFDMETSRARINKRSKIRRIGRNGSGNRRIKSGQALRNDLVRTNNEMRRNGEVKRRRMKTGTGRS
jgi:hypothetical protein